MTIVTDMRGTRTSSETDAAARAYLEAAGGDADRALRRAARDLLRMEEAMDAMREAVAHGLARAGRGRHRDL